MLKSEIKNNCVWIGIGINITAHEEEYESLLKINEILVKKYGSTYKFDPIFQQPHLNLYDIDIPYSNLGKVKNKLQEITNNSRAFIIKLEGISYFDHGTILIKCELDEKLKLFERKIVAEIAPLRDSCRTEDYWKPGRFYTAQQLECREKYGNPYVADAYYPHSSIGFIKTEKKTLERIARELNEIFNLRQIEVKHLDIVVHDMEEKLIEANSYKLAS